jgi:hypothetical protein
MGHFGHDLGHKNMVQDVFVAEGGNHLALHQQFSLDRASGDQGEPLTGQAKFYPQGAFEHSLPLYQQSNSYGNETQSVLEAPIWHGEDDLNEYRGRGHDLRMSYGEETRMMPQQSLPVMPLAHQVKLDLAKNQPDYGLLLTKNSNSQLGNFQTNRQGPVQVRPPVLHLNDEDQEFIDDEVSSSDGRVPQDGIVRGPLQHNANNQTAVRHQWQSYVEYE